ncbi:hypothetical protein ACIP10_00725 [Streptomyces galbus]|uniref:hypothetical protein n=1 Tax=Streptomyces galbus TaxID=33898 RepID=UPI0037A7FE7E
MGALKVTVRSATAAAALAVTALVPAAYAAAADGRGVSVTPSSPAPGTDVTLRVGGCASRTAVAVSEAFVADARLTGADGTLVGETRVRTSAAPGAHTVRVSCAGVRVDGTVQVAAASAAQGAGASAAASPVAPVAAGGGGTAQITVADARIEGPGAAQAVTGLVLAGVAATAVVLRSARRNREAD